MEDFSPNTQVHANTLRVSLFTIFLLCIAYAFAQLSSTNKKAIKLYEKADKEYKARDFQSALSLLEEAGRLDKTFFEAFSRMGGLYNALGELDSVYTKFAHYLKVAPNPSVSVLERMAFMAFDRGDYSQSAIYLNQLLIKAPSKRKDREIILLQESQRFASAQISNPHSIPIIELPRQINRYDLQYLPAMTVDKSTMVYTKRDLISDDEDIVVSYHREGGWTQAESISSNINTALNEGASTISADGRTMIFTACDRRNSLGSCDLYFTRKTGESWSRPKNLGHPVNSKYWESQPSLSADGNTLYFVSNRPGGVGGRDIWWTVRVNGNWTAPKNLGDQVNSFKDETTPFIHFSGETLFFSSNGYPGMGGFDLFKINRRDTVWEKPENLGSPINSYRDEVALLVAADGEEGYFAKEIKKGRQISDSKIVSFKLPDTLKPVKSSYVIGKVIDEENKEPLKASVEVVDLHSEDVLYRNASDSLTGQYYMVLPTNKELGGYVKRKGYLYKDFSFSVGSGIIDSLVIELSKIELGKRIILRNIYFETDSHHLNEKSNVEIESAADLLLSNPDLVIQIEGHTDNVGRDDYNLDLSMRRAREVYKALIAKGINESKLQSKGFGSSKPIRPNDSEANRQSNRRIEFRVIRTRQ